MSVYVRVVGLASAVLAAALVPLAAWGQVVPGGAEDEYGVVRAEPGPSLPSPTGRPRPAPVTPQAAQAAQGAGTSEITPSTSPTPSTRGTEGTQVTRVRCGPELSSPEGVEAQTCVLADGLATWARTYYRNATGAKLTSVLTLMGPQGRTLQINCTVEAGDEPGVCETPRERSGSGAGYSAVAEFAAAGAGPDVSADAAVGAPADMSADDSVDAAVGVVQDGPGAGRLLLRAGSNSARTSGG